jgi:hypothetical protein
MYIPSTRSEGPALLATTGVIASRFRVRGFKKLRKLDAGPGHVVDLHFFAGLSRRNRGCFGCVCRNRKARLAVCQGLAATRAYQGPRKPRRLYSPKKSDASRSVLP